MLLKLFTAGALAAASLLASDAAEAQILTNGGFEDGVTSSTIDGNTNPNVPTGWTASAAFDAQAGFNHLSTSSHSGLEALLIGNFDSQPVAMLSQSFGDVAGEIYTVSFWAFDGGANGDSNAFLTVSAGGGSDSFNDTVSAYTQGGFTFTGAGHDIITIAAATNPNEWDVDDISVTDASRSVGGPGVPEPAAWAMMILGLGGAGVMLRRRRGQPALA